MLVRKKVFVNFPSFFGHRICILETTSIGKIPDGEDEVVGGGGYLIRGISNFSGTRKINRHLNLVENGTKRLIDVVCSGNAGGVIL